MNKINYQKEMEQIIGALQHRQSVPRLFLHSCCAPCSSYVFEYLVPFFNITALFYNPNISPKTEYDFRLNELKRLIFDMNLTSKINLIEEPYELQKFKEISLGLEDCQEGSSRCFKCYYLRLQKAAVIAQKLNFDYFTTTLTISPYKNADKLNEIGAMLASEYGVEYLFSDFKKKDGYKRSIELSKKYSLYRQNYCGCKFSKKVSV